MEHAVARQSLGFPGVGERDREDILDLLVVVPRHQRGDEDRDEAADKAGAELVQVLPEGHWLALFLVLGVFLVRRRGRGLVQGGLGRGLGLGLGLGRGRGACVAHSGSPPSSSVNAPYASQPRTGYSRSRSGG